MNNTLTTENILYSIVVPVYNSQKSLKELCQRIDNTFKSIDKPYEIILIDDASKDYSWQEMLAIREENRNVKLIQLMRNFGQHNAIICGLNFVSGEYVITLDDDLQNPPEEIPKLIACIEEGRYDCVIGVQKNRKDKFYKKKGSAFIQYLNTKIFNKPPDIKLSSFRIISRELADHIIHIKTPYPYISGMILSYTLNIGNVSVNHEKRKYGQSNYNLKKLIKHSFNLIINYTSIPLKILTIFGMTVSFFAFMMGCFFIVRKFMNENVVMGWTSVVVLLSFFNGILIAILSFMGEYLSRILKEISNTNQFVIRQKRL